MEQALNQNSSTGYCPFNVGQHLLQSFSLVFTHGTVLLQEAQVGFGHGVVGELLVHVFNEIGVSNKIARRNSIFVGECFDLIFCKMDAKKLHSGGQTRNELIFDAEALPELVIILEENFHANLLLPDFCTDVSLYLSDGAGLEPVGADLHRSTST